MQYIAMQCNANYTALNACAQCNSVWRILGLTDSSFLRAPLSATMFARRLRNRPPGPATPAHRAICRSSSSERRPAKNRQYHCIHPYGSCSRIQPLRSQSLRDEPTLTPYRLMLLSHVLDVRCASGMPVHHDAGNSRCTLRCDLPVTLDCMGRQ